MIIPYKYMNKAVVTFSVAVLALAGCESDSDSSFRQGRRLGLAREF